MNDIFETAIVEKRNVLNELRSNNMTLQELRFFSIYLSKINPFDISTRVVRFSVEDFQRIMSFGRVNIAQLRSCTDSLLCKLVHVPDEDGRGLRTFQLFKECYLFQDDDEKWYIEIDAHDKALPLMFDFKNRYFKYELWNALRLKSPNQLRMYEILKQYEHIGKREISVCELKELLGIGKKEYSDRTGWSNFKKKVLDSCQQALKENTDISYTYERGQTGQGGKWVTIVFNIKKNKEFKDKLSLTDFIEIQNDNVPLETEYVNKNFDNNCVYEESIDVDYGTELANLLGSSALEDEFSPEQVRVIQDLVLNAVHSNNHLEMCDYLIKQIHKMNVYNPTKEKRFTYLCRMIETDIEKD